MASSATARTNTRLYGSRRRRPSGLPVATRSYVGWITDPKAGGAIPFRSEIERGWLTHLFFDPAVASIARNDLSEMERLEWRLGSAPRANRVFVLPDSGLGHPAYTPDLRVELRDGRVIYAEVGAHETKTDDDAAQRLQSAAVEAVKEGAGFLVLTDRLARGVLLENRMRLFGFLHPVALDIEAATLARELLRTSDERLSVVDAVPRVRARLGREVPDDVVEQAVCIVIAEAHRSGVLLCDLEEVRWDLVTKVSIAQGDEPIGPSLVEDLLAGQRTAPPQAEYRSRRAGLAVAQHVEVPAVSQDLSEEDRALFAARLALVRDREAHPSDTWVTIATRHRFSESAARYWWGEYVYGGEADLRPRSRKSAGLRVFLRESTGAINGATPRRVAPIEVTARVIETVTKLYRHSRSQNVRQILEHPELRATLREFGVDLSYDSLAGFVRRFLRDDEQLDAHRRGAKRLPPRPTSGPVYRHPKPERLLQVVETDAARADIHLLASDGVSVVERLWILYAVDVASRCLWAWRYCLSDPTEVDYLQLIHRGIQPKDDVAAACGAQTPYPVHGIPELVLADRGWIFAAQRSRERLQHHGVVVMHAAPHMPQMKPHIERVIGTMNTRLLHRLPGTTKENPLKKGGRDAIAEAERYGLTVETFTRLMDRAIIDGLGNALHSTLGCAPLERWEKLERKHGHPRRWPSDPASELLLELLPLKDGGTRMRGHGGYEFANVLYRPEAADAPRLARVLYDPDDVRCVALLHAEGAHEGEYSCEAIARNLDLRVAISEAELGRIFAVSPESRRRARLADETLTDIVEQVEAGKSLARRQATRFEKALRGARHGALAAQAGTPALPAPTAARDDGEDDDLPLEPVPDFAPESR